ncbi:mannose-1-phosphate guanylyltransferase/mannose-6-phosphate isomerase [Pseudoalteromonas pernae]|uniref:mannose-1-phosphate guanylyltransferase/mannose-6-phosphate isomerase n=1 Tax=Pseudoalteromonas pernae TaxID=3118054 RepID=UPI003242C978
MILPILLAGGSGTRLWPLSRQDRPKQFIQLVGQHSLLQKAALRFVANGCLPPVVVCSEQHRFMVAQQLLEIGVQASAIILEPSGKNTAPAALVAALWAQQHQPDAQLFFAPADHAISDFDTLLTRLHDLVPDVQNTLLVFGITPTHAETGFGYIHCGAHSGISDDDVYHVESFTEKPDLGRAQQYLEQGCYVWNSGMLMAGVDTFLTEFKRCRSEMYIQVERAANFSADLDFIRVDQAMWQQVTSESLDYAILENSDKLLVCLSTLHWFDLGSYEQLSRFYNADNCNNVVLGEAVVVDGKDNFIYTEDNHLVTTLGIKGAVIIHSGDTTLVASKDSLDDMPKLLNEVSARFPERREFHKRTFRPWGQYEVLNEADNYKVKRITLSAHTRLSLQAHQHRSEHWVVVKGTVDVTVDEHLQTLQSGQSIYIQAGQRHRLANTTDDIAVVIEVQNGEYLGEDDIVRFDDDYGR